MFDKTILVKENSEREGKTRETGGKEKTERRSGSCHARKEVAKRKRSASEEGTRSTQQFNDCKLLNLHAFCNHVLYMLASNVGF